MIREGRLVIGHKRHPFFPNTPPLKRTAKPAHVFLTLRIRGGTSAVDPSASFATIVK